VANERELSVTEGSSSPEVLGTKSERLEAIEELRKFEGIMPADFKFDREEANRR